MQWIMGDHALCCLAIDDIRMGIHLCLSSSYNILSTLLLIMPSGLPFYTQWWTESVFTYSIPSSCSQKNHFKKYAPHCYCWRLLLPGWRARSGGTITIADIADGIPTKLSSWEYVIPILARIFDARIFFHYTFSFDVLHLWVKCIKQFEKVVVVM